MTGAAHRRTEYALILVGILLVGVFAAWASNRLEGNLTVTQDIYCQQDLSVTRDCTITDDLTVVDDCTFSDAVSIAGALTLADSTYTAADITLAADEIIRATYIGILEAGGAFADTTGLPTHCLAARGGSLFMLANDKGSWKTVYSP